MLITLNKVRISLNIWTDHFLSFAIRDCERLSTYLNRTCTTLKISHQDQIIQIQKYNWTFSDSNEVLIWDKVYENEALCIQAKPPLNLNPLTFLIYIHVAKTNEY